MKSSRQKFAKYLQLVNRHGAESSQVQMFLRTNASDADLHRLVRLTNFMKKTLDEGEEGVQEPEAHSLYS